MFSLLGACALTSSPENCLIAYPAQPSVSSSPLAPFGQPVSPPPTPKHNDISGDVEIFDAVNMQLIKIIPAHKSPISCLAMNADATLLATASEKVNVLTVQRLCLYSNNNSYRELSFACFLCQMPTKCLNSGVDHIQLAFIPFHSISPAPCYVYQVTPRQCIFSESQQLKRTLMEKKQKLE